jgi:two-component system CheB/CheR fusion protein
LNSSLTIKSSIFRKCLCTIHFHKSFRIAIDIIGIHSELLERYFQKTEYGYVFHSELHRLIVFKQHDLMQDAPILAIDLLICRNVLMYFTKKAQASILAHFHSALKNTGFLFLGQVETLVYHRQLFTPVALKQRFYNKKLDLDFERRTLSR